MQDVGLARDQLAFDDVRLALYRSPGVDHIAVLIFHHKFGSAKFLVSGDIRLAHMDLRGFILHDHGLYFTVFPYFKDDVAGNCITVR